MLGLKVTSDLFWKRDSPLPSVNSQRLTRRQVHQLVGEWLGHFPVAGWLQVACGYLQHCTANDGVGWDDKVSSPTCCKVMDVEKRLREVGDPVAGCWQVAATGKGAIWVDASSLAMGVVVEIDGDVVEDAAWL